MFEEKDGKVGNTAVFHKVEYAEVFHKDVELAALQNKVLRVANDFEMSNDFTLQVASKACDIIFENSENGKMEWNNSEINLNILEKSIHAAIPIWKEDLMAIYLLDTNIVDEACRSMGIEEGTISRQSAQVGWYYAIEEMVHALLSEIE